MAASTGLGIFFIAAVVLALAAAKASTADAVTGAGAGNGSPSPSGAGVSTLIALLGEAIATAEGFYRANSLPERQNNPGNVTDPASGCICTFPTLQEGWQALYHQIQLMFDGSAYYNSGMSIAEIGRVYANKDPNWSKNVAAYLGVPESTTLDELSAQYGG